MKKLCICLKDDSPVEIVISEEQYDQLYKRAINEGSWKRPVFIVRRVELIDDGKITADTKRLTYTDKTFTQVNNTQGE
jgi:hypothetical protein